MTHPVDDPNEPARQRLSALCDGEADAAEAERGFESWRNEPALRARWHAYQWIGDVMRSDDLASDPEHDQAFLSALRARLAEEPIVLAPVRRPTAVDAPVQPVPVAAEGGARRVRWGAPVAMAAGVMVTGALVVMNFTRAPAPAGEPLLVDATPAPARAESASDAAQVGDMLRNPELDRYLNAHRQFVGSTTLAVPGGVRQVAATSDGR